MPAGSRAQFLSIANVGRGWSVLGGGVTSHWSCLSAAAVPGVARGGRPGRPQLLAGHPRRPVPFRAVGHSRSAYDDAAAEGWVGPLCVPLGRLFGSRRGARRLWQSLGARCGRCSRWVAIGVPSPRHTSNASHSACLSVWWGWIVNARIEDVWD
jgi:hypothetical protein